MCGSFGDSGRRHLTLAGCACQDGDWYESLPSFHPLTSLQPMLRPLPSRNRFFSVSAIVLASSSNRSSSSVLAGHSFVHEVSMLCHNLGAETLP